MLPTVPPPEIGLKIRPKRIIRKARRVAVKVHTAPIKAVAKAGKGAMMTAAKLAAKPIRAAFRKLAMRRARLLSWRARKSMTPTPAEKAQASVWAIKRVRGKGPIGALAVKILRFTKGASLGFKITPVQALKVALALPLTAATVRIVREAATLGASHDETLAKALRHWHKIEHGQASTVGLTGAEIAAAAAAIVNAIAQIIRSLDKPGEAPADPRQAEEPEEAETEGWGLLPP